MVKLFQFLEGLTFSASLLSFITKLLKMNFGLIEMITVGMEDEIAGN